LIAASSTHQLLHDFLHAPEGKQASKNPNCYESEDCDASVLMEIVRPSPIISDLHACCSAAAGRSSAGGSSTPWIHETFDRSRVSEIPKQAIHLFLC
jgi:hypothetical protein